jgi:hypothetical protein
LHSQICNIGLELYYAAHNDLWCSLLFFRGLFYCAFVIFYCVTSVLNWLVNDEFVKIWKEAVVAKSKYCPEIWQQELQENTNKIGVPGRV